MNDIIRRVSPENWRLIVGGLMLLLFAWQVWTYSVPEFQSYLEKRSEIEAQEQKMDAAKTLSATKEQIEERFRRVTVAMDSVRDRFPQRNQILSILLVDLSQIFKDTGTTIVNFEPLGFKPLEQQALKDLGRMQIRIQARGEYPAIILLFDRLSHYERVLRVEAPQLSPAGSGGDAVVAEDGAAAAMPASAPDEGGFNKTLDATFVLTTYALNR